MTWISFEPKEHKPNVLTHKQFYWFSSLNSSLMGMFNKYKSSYTVNKENLIKKCNNQFNFQVQQQPQKTGFGVPHNIWTIYRMLHLSHFLVQCDQITWSCPQYCSRLWFWVGCSETELLSCQFISLSFCLTQHLAWALTVEQLYPVTYCNRLGLPSFSPQ